MNASQVVLDRIGEVDASAAKTLAIELLELTAVEISKPLQASTEQSRRHRENAERWAGLHSDEIPAPTGAVTFDFCCEVLGVEPNAVRSAIRSDPAGLIARLRAVALTVSAGASARHAHAVRAPRPH